MLLNIDNKLTDSYYEDSVSRSATSPQLAGDINADICIVGGGLAGLSAALELAQRGYSVALLEANKIGWGASGRNGGQALVGFAADDAIESQLSGDDARRVWKMTVEGLQLLRQRIATHAIDCDFVPGLHELGCEPKEGASLVGLDRACGARV